MQGQRCECDGNLLELLEVPTIQFYAFSPFLTTSLSFAPSRQPIRPKFVRALTLLNILACTYVGDRPDSVRMHNYWV